MKPLLLFCLVIAYCHSVNAQRTYVLVKDGNYALETGAGAGALLLAGGLIDYLQQKSHNPDFRLGEDVWVLAGLVGAGALIGGVAGALTPRYSTLYVYEKHKFALKINPNLNSQYVGVCMKVNF